MAFAPLTREQMLDRCDLAGVARVISVGRESLDSPNLAVLSFVRVFKGAPPEPEALVTVRLHGTAPALDGLQGAWSDWWDYPIGSTVMTHLDWNGPDAVYETTWPGAVLEVEEAIAKVA